MVDYGPKLPPPAAAEDARNGPGPERPVFTGKIMNSMKSVTVMVMDGVAALRSRPRPLPGVATLPEVWKKNKQTKTICFRRGGEIQ